GFSRHGRLVLTQHGDLIWQALPGGPRLVNTDGRHPAGQSGRHFGHGSDMVTNQAAGENPLKVFGAMLAYYRNRVGMTPEQLGARVYMSGSLIRQVVAGTRPTSAELAKSC